MKHWRIVAACAATVIASGALAQNRASLPLPQLPMIVETAELKVRVSEVAGGLANPWSLAWLPNGDLLVTERAGRLRLIRDGRLDPMPIGGVPTVHVAILAGLFEVLPHPGFATNRILYLSYAKVREDRQATTVIARARLEGHALVDLREIFVANNWTASATNYGGRMVFGRDGMLYMAVGERQEQDRAQNTLLHGGKVVRLRDDGSVPPDNPFVGREGYLPEIYTVGHRSPQGLAVHPVTGELWENEHGPLGGDEINILKAGANYGWPLVTYGTDYDGTTISELTSRPDLEAPFIYFVPSIAPSGMSFYTGDRLAAWRGNAFVGALFEGRTRATGHIRRITFSENGRPIQREPILRELRQRIRDVRPGPDGLLYVLTDENPGVVLRVEPAE